MSTLAERLGYGPEEKLLIVNCDDLGSSAAANRATEAAFRAGSATSATLMVPCPWALDGAARAKAAGAGVGVHLTFTCEYPTYRWRALTGGASLHDGQGYMPATAEAVWAQADLDEVRAECRAQIDQALAWGVDVTHLDTHMGVMQLDPPYFDIYVDLAAEYGLPLRMAGAKAEARIGIAGRALAAERRIVFPDHMTSTSLQMAAGGRTFDDVLAGLRPGVTEVFFHPVEEGPELRAYDPDLPDGRIADHLLLTDPVLPARIAAAGATLISFKPLRDLQRAH
ncbi:ChbG/HpnK family deacetylase [Phenylobacterium sp.]|uniref:ChbG/HpnK family deacetylase n=1 Tax=Phenylobacterium sp. TaxID=1871053 RepID=UPI0025E5DD5C|nr:ChbG/HpnK family deacetylase [Phenylobacterium sp.]